MVTIKQRNSVAKFISEVARTVHKLLANAEDFPRFVLVINQGLSILTD